MARAGAARLAHQVRNEIRASAQRVHVLGVGGQEAQSLHRHQHHLMVRIAQVIDEAAQAACAPP